MSPVLALLCLAAVLPLSIDASAVGRVVLLDEKGINRRPIQGQTESSPIGGVFVRSQGEELVVACNAFQAVRTGARGWLLTSRHCLADGPKGGRPVESHFIYFDRLTGLQRSVSLDVKRTVLLSLKMDAKGSVFDADLVALPIPLDDSHRVDLADPFEEGPPPAPPSEQWSRYFISAFRPTFDDDRAIPVTESLPFEFHRYECRGRRGVSPSLLARADDKKGKPFVQPYYLSYSKQGRALEERPALFLDRCNPAHATSGALVVDDKGSPVGSFHSVIDVPLVKDKWEKDLRHRFTRAAEPVGLASPSSASLALIWSGQETAIALDSQSALYAVAVDLLEVRRLGQPFLKQLTDD